jgi:uncharacterized membrane protein YczE
MGFLSLTPIVNQSGKRVVRWPRLVLLWVAIILAAALGGGAASYALMGDFWHYASFAVGFGVVLAALTTGLWLRLPVEKLPQIR